jgi:hypothetical protein
VVLAIEDTVPKSSRGADGCRKISFAPTEELAGRHADRTATSIAYFCMPATFAVWWCHEGVGG